MNPFLSTHDLKVVCSKCSVRANEISYTLQPVAHQCDSNLLLGRAKGSGPWRPISRRPEFPKPSKYEVCWHFVEGSGCTKHKNRCTFARSAEEAAVWNFERQQGLDHRSLRCLLDQTGGGQTGGGQTGGGPLRDAAVAQGHFESLDHILKCFNLKGACNLCSIKENDITYTINRVSHLCQQYLFLARFKGSDIWRPVADRPVGTNCGPNVVYQVCRFFEEGSGCRRDGPSCTFARSQEEASLWNFAKNMNMDNSTILQHLNDCNSLTPEDTARNILKEFTGQFLELCQDCFLSGPQKLAVLSEDGTCSAEDTDRHTWKPILVHHVSEHGGKEVYHKVRLLPPSCTFEYCIHVSQGKPCWHEVTSCHSAHSEVEMAVWRAESGQPAAAVRPQLLRLSQEQQQSDGGEGAAFHCKACLLSFSSKERFLQHCATLEHAQIINDDTSTQWETRPPPHNHREHFALCARPNTCEYGDRCLKAHSEEELREWQMRTKEEEDIRANIHAQGLISYADRLLTEYTHCSNEGHTIISEQVDDVSVTCQEELLIECQETNVKFQWNFQVDTERILQHVALLKNQAGASFSLNAITSGPVCCYSLGKRFHNTDKQTYHITVDFASAIPGLYEQWLVLDFDMRPVLLRKLKTLRPETYRENMHNFLYKEEQAENELVSRIGVRGEMTTSENLLTKHAGTVIANQGELFCTVSAPFNLTPDTPEGYVLKRSIQSGLIAPLCPKDPDSKVYETIILKHTANKNQIHLKLSERCCSDLQLKSGETHQMELQFQLDRLSFCIMHKAIDLLPDTTMVLPDLENCEVPMNSTRYHNLNVKQQAAVDFIIGKSNSWKGVAPLLIYGPFGTGKTFTLATAAREVTRNPQNKVLICTHTNSSADLYVKDHFHPLIVYGDHSIKPIRIKAKQHSSVQATDETTLKYCLLSASRTYFLPPTKNVLDSHNIVITTSTMAKRFHELNLPKGYFTHILIDEASQMLECEALIPLGLAGPRTRVALAGDHMQMGPKLFSVDDHQRSNHTLLNRLFHYYHGHNSDVAQKSRIIFNENYRSTKEIVEFVSTHFYVGKGDIIKCGKTVPAGPNDHSLKFHHVRGDCQLDTVSMSWSNDAEVVTVVNAVEDIVRQWPPTWGTRDLSSICVLSEGWQPKYVHTDEYIAVWKPLCEIESAETAVKEGDSIIIEDLVVNFHHKHGCLPKGSFSLPLTHIKEWAIECNLAKCLLCIRKSGLQPASTLSHSEKVDPSSFTWVAHGVTEKEEKIEKVMKVDFSVSHLPMELFPDCVFQKDTSYTVELIPKLPPDMSITLHHLMREDGNPFSQDIKEFDKKIKLALTGDEAKLTDDQVDEYKALLKKAREHEFKQHDVVLCTCTTSSSPALTKTVSARQILIDECAMATEPQALIPLVCNKPEKHEEICQFPSEAYYENDLKTAVKPPNSVLLVDKKPKTIVFVHITGEEISLVVNTKSGNENSKANIAEQDKAVEIAQSLVLKARIKPEGIVILAPYNAQVSGIKAALRKKNLSKITVTTITKSQGSEWRYVIMSTVRSLPSKDIEKDADRSWRSKHLGFVGDPNQINVGITRAKEGLCILGEQGP
ncbi:hypothetical protein NHX12_030573 [Muraenolepis orangiensis]|uniref:C3H1-type domain-containing protein n=1 Tax=Muraenolepis orangiensis TaxID=630683 RepID=A0A9Q0E800_9TELE|nr:hypothetical protein NHX12_030573 [Muraenolepis orangiensis]